MRFLVYYYYKDEFDLVLLHRKQKNILFSASK